MTPSTPNPPDGDFAAACAHPAVTLFSCLLACPAPPRHEMGIAAVIRAEIDRIGFAHTTDAAGNVIVRLESEAPDQPLTLLAAHMDEIGLTVVGIEPDGALRVIPSGGMTTQKTGERPLTFLGAKRCITGILSLGSGHDTSRGLTRAPEAAAGLTPWDLQLRDWQGARVITGLSPEALRAAGVQIGTTGTVSPEMRGPVLLGDPADPLIAAWTFDDRMGCVALLRLLAHVKSSGVRPKRPLAIAFSTHEEGACHGAMLLCHQLRPEVFLAVDGCPITGDMPLTMDGRPGIWTRDIKAIYDFELVETLCRMAGEVGTELQRAVYVKASSDASAAYAVGAVPRIAFMGHVRANSHGFEVARLSVFDNVLAVLKRFVETWE